MAVTRAPRSITFSADADAASGPFFCESVKLVGTGMTPASRLLVLDRISGSVLFDHYVEQAEVNHEFLVEKKWIEGIYIETAPTGTWLLVIAWA